MGEGGLGVRVEAEFTVDEYEVVILSAEDALGLETWLHQQRTRSPPAPRRCLRPYVQGGMKFFVAKVTAAKVKFKDGQAMLSPLRFHYDSDTFGLPSGSAWSTRRARRISSSTSSRGSSATRPPTTPTSPSPPTST